MKILSYLLKNKVSIVLLFIISLILVFSQFKVAKAAHRCDGPAGDLGGTVYINMEGRTFPLDDNTTEGNPELNAVAYDGDREVGRANTGPNGGFTITGLDPGSTISLKTEITKEWFESWVPRIISNDPIIGNSAAKGWETLFGGRDIITGTLTVTLFEDTKTCLDQNEFIVSISDSENIAIELLRIRFEGIITTAINWVAGFFKITLQATKHVVNKTVIIKAEDFGGNTGISSAWAAIRNFCNILFILGVLIIALASVFRVDIEKYDIRILLPKLIIAMILINLSFLMCRAIIDLSNAMSKSFIYMNIGVNESEIDREDIGKHIINSITGVDDQGNPVNPITYLKTNLEAVGIANIVAILGPVGVMLAALLILFLAFIAGVYIMILLLVRIVMIWFLVIISPIVFLFSVLPFTQGLTKSWWTQFSKFVFMGPLVILVLSIGERVAIYYAANPGESVLLTPLFCIGMLFAAAIIPSMMGGKIIGAVAGHLSGAGKWASTKGWNKAWTGKADGKGAGGMRERVFNAASREKKASLRHEMMEKTQESKAKNQLLDEIHTKRFNTATGKYEGVEKNEEKLIENKLGSNIENLKNTPGTDLAKRIQTKHQVLNSIGNMIPEFDDQGKYMGNVPLRTSDPVHKKLLIQAGLWDKGRVKTGADLTLRDKLQFQAERVKLGDISIQAGSTGQKAITETLGAGDYNKGRDMLNNKGQFAKNNKADFSNEDKHFSGLNF